MKKTSISAPSVMDMSHFQTAKDSRNMLLKNTLTTDTGALIVVRLSVARVVNSIWKGTLKGYTPVSYALAVGKRLLILRGRNTPSTPSEIHHHVPSREDGALSRLKM